MNYTNLGRTGIKVSRLCLGCMSFGVPQRGGHPGRGAESSFHQACPGPRHQLPRHPQFLLRWHEGEILGRALREFARRDEVVIATKVYYPTRKDPNGRGLSRKAITGTQELWGSGHVFSFFTEETKNMA